MCWEMDVDVIVKSEREGRVLKAMEFIRSHLVVRSWLYTNFSWALFVIRAPSEARGYVHVIHYSLDLAVSLYLVREVLSIFPNQTKIN
jgi:hypothetical protein